eukprot:2276736-Amphidinium_carterae.1
MEIAGQDYANGYLSMLDKADAACHIAALAAFPMENLLREVMGDARVPFRLQRLQELLRSE